MALLGLVVASLALLAPPPGWRSEERGQGVTLYVRESGGSLRVVALPEETLREAPESWFRRRQGELANGWTEQTKVSSQAGTLIVGGRSKGAPALLVGRYGGGRGRVFLIGAATAAELSGGDPRVSDLIVALTRDFGTAGGGEKPAPAKRPVERETVGVPATPGKPLPPASVGGARFFIKYRMTYFEGVTVSLDPLILFPDGSAVRDLPSKPFPRFDAATVKAAVRPVDVGRWRQTSPKTIELKFPKETRTLRKTAEGWYDDDGPLKDENFDTYFPVRPATKATIAGAWRNQNLVTSGMMGGGTASVASGSTTDLVLSANGTFSNRREGFASATTANMGDAFKSGGDVTTFSENKKAGQGRWRLDGPLLTRESNGRRTVEVAFFLPNWNQKGPAELYIQGNRYERPGKG